MTCFRLENGESARSVIKKLGGCYRVFFNCMEDGMNIKDAIVKSITKSNKKRNIPRTFLNGIPITNIFKTNSSKYVKVMTDIRNGKSVEDAVRDATVRKCKHCGELYELNHSPYCCDECRYMDITKEVECSWCGRLFRLKNSVANKRRKYGIFCCQDCFNKARVYAKKKARDRSTYHIKYGSGEKNRNIKV